MSHWPPKQQHRPSHAQTFGRGQPGAPAMPPEVPPPENPPPENPPPVDPPVNPPPAQAPSVIVPHPTKGRRSEEQKREAQRQRFRAQLEAAGKKYGGVENLLKKAREDAQKELDSRHPLTKEHHERMQRSWELALAETAPDLDPNNYWLDTTVQRYAAEFLRTKTMTTVGLKSELCNAGTAGSWVSHLVYCISKFTHKSSGTRCGYELLRNGLWQKLDDTLRDVIKEFNLERHNYSKLVSYGKEEFQLIAEQALEGGRGRILKLQTMVGVYCAFTSGIRPSGLAAPHGEFVELGRYMRLGDIRPIRTGRFSFDLHITFKNHKGWNNTTQGLLTVHVYKALKNVENLVFDPIWMVAYMTARGAFAQKNIQGVIDSNEHELKVVIPDEPLQAISGGTDLIRPITPATADNVSYAVSHLMKSAGFDGSMYAFRHGTANHFDVCLGSHKASTILGHSDARSTLSTFYSMSTANFDLLGIRTGEATEQYQPGVKESLALHCRTRAAVALLASRAATERLKREGKEDDPDTTNEDDLEELTRAAKKEAIENSDDVEVAEQNVDTAWSAFLAIIGPGTVDHAKACKTKRVQQNIKNIKDREGFQQAIAASPAVAALAVQLEAELRDRFKELAVAKAAVRRVAKVDVTRKFEKRPKPSDTVTERDEAIAHFAKPSKILENPAGPSSSKAVAIELAPLPPRKPAHELSESEASTSATCLHPRNEELARIAAADVDVPQDEAAKAALDLFNLPHKSHCGITPENSETLTQVLVSAAGEAPKATQIDAMDSEMFLDKPLEPYNDKDEEPMIKDLSMDDAREAFFRLLLAPIERERELKRQTAADGGKLLCQLCKRDPKDKGHVWDTVGHLDRHIMVRHTDWNDLTLRIKRQGGKFLCPASNCQKPLGSEKIIRRHCVSAACPEHEGFKLMKELHKDTMRQYRLKYGVPTEADLRWSRGEIADDEDGDEGEDDSDDSDDDSDDLYSPLSGTRTAQATRMSTLDMETLLRIGTSPLVNFDELQAGAAEILEELNKMGGEVLEY